MCLLSCLILVFLLSGGSAVTEDQLIGIVKDIKNAYKIQAQTCVVMAVPEDNYDYDAILRENHKSKVDTLMAEKNGLYVDKDIIIAKPLFDQTHIHTQQTYTIHAEERVLENLGSLTETRDQKFLLMYSFLSPCKKCAESISTSTVIKQWKPRYLVFTRVYDKTSIGSKVEEEKRRVALVNVGKTFDYNVFRCYEQDNSDIQCVKCFKKGEGPGLKLQQVCLENGEKEEEGESGGAASGAASGDNEWQTARKPKSKVKGGGHKGGATGGGGVRQ